MLIAVQYNQNVCVYMIVGTSDGNREYPSLVSW